jgi:DNA-binding transcriptional MerR regulator
LIAQRTNDRSLFRTPPCRLSHPPPPTRLPISREFDITPRAIRFYEDQGLLAPDREGPSGRKRVYNGRERTRLKLTLRGKRLGLTLNEIREILDLYESPRDTAPQLERFLHLLAQHRGTLERQLEDLQAQLAEIDQHERQCKAAGCPSCRERRHKTPTA